MQVHFELPTKQGNKSESTFVVVMDRLPEIADQIVVKGAKGAVAYNVRRISWHIQLHRDIHGDLLDPHVHLELDK